MGLERAGRAMLPLACAGALALGCAPAAFAADGVGEDGPFDNDNQAATAVKVKTDTHLSARVPITLHISASIDGGDITAPSSGVYGITNLSHFKIKVSEVTVAAGENWEYSNSALTSSSGEPTTAGKTGFINLALKPDGQSAATTLTSSAVQPDWQIDKATDANGKKLPIAVSGSTSKLTKVIDGTSNAEETAATITYKIASA